jgi:hypothetical protein
VPDDTGVQAAYSEFHDPKGARLTSLASGLHSAFSTLDSIRAVIKSGNITGISSDPVITINGYSGGSIPAGWVRSTPKVQFSS